MAYGEYGGNGSVHWLIDADDVDDAVEKGRMFGNGRRPGGREWRHHGVDYHGKKDEVGTDFTIRVKLPRDARVRAAWIDNLRRKLASGEDIFEFELPIEKSDEPHTQIQICWGRGTVWNDNLYRLSQELKGGPPSK
jgi:hypothetical protein